MRPLLLLSQIRSPLILQSSGQMPVLHKHALQVGRQLQELNKSPKWRTIAHAFKLPTNSHTTASVLVGREGKVQVTCAGPWSGCDVGGQILQPTQLISGPWAPQILRTYALG